MSVGNRVCVVGARNIILFGPPLKATVPGRHSFPRSACNDGCNDRSRCHQHHPPSPCPSPPPPLPSTSPDSTPRQKNQVRLPLPCLHELTLPQSSAPSSTPSSPHTAACESPASAIVVVLRQRSIDVVAKKDGGLRGQAFVVFAEQTAATSAMRQLAGESFYDHTLVRYSTIPSRVSLPLTHPRG